jgi:hypothetical protein
MSRVGYLTVRKNKKIDTFSLQDLPSMQEEIKSKVGEGSLTFGL